MKSGQDNDINSFDDYIKALVKGGDFEYATDREIGISVLLDMVPLLGEFKLGYEILVGEDLVSHVSLSAEERGILIATLGIGKLVKYGVGKIVGKGGKAVEGTSKANIRVIDELTDCEFLEKMKEVRKNIPKKIRGKYNFGYADVNIEGIEKKEFFAHSGIKDINSIENPLQREKLSDISIEPSQSKKVFNTLEVNERNEVNGIGAWDRGRDTEFKILNEIANKLGDNTKASGKIRLYTDLDCCPSCKNVINQFQERYSNIDIEIIYKTRGGGK